MMLKSLFIQALFVDPDLAPFFCCLTLHFDIQRLFSIDILTGYSSKVFSDTLLPKGIFMESTRILKRLVALWLLLLMPVTGLVILLKAPLICSAQTLTEYTHKPSGETDRGPAAQDLPKEIASLAPRGWKIFDKVKQFTPQNLYDQINGRAEFFLAYDLIRMTFASFINNADEGQFIDLSIYDMGSSTNAFGVFSGERSPGETPVRLGREGYRTDANFYIWKGRYYIRIIASGSTDEFKKIGMDLAGKVTGFLQDSGEPVWGLAALPLVGRVPKSVRYVKADAMGLDFMKQTYMARYRVGNTTVTVFLSQQDTPEMARTILSRYEDYASKYGEGLDRIKQDGVELVTCDMGDNYDIIFQKGRLVGGVSSVDNRTLALQAAINLWNQLTHE